MEDNSYGRKAKDIYLALSIHCILSSKIEFHLRHVVKFTAVVQTEIVQQQDDTMW